MKIISPVDGERIALESWRVYERTQYFSKIRWPVAGLYIIQQILSARFSGKDFLLLSSQSWP